MTWIWNLNNTSVYLNLLAAALLQKLSFKILKIFVTVCIFVLLYIYNHFPLGS